jgi:hypothetical protein
MFHRLLRAAALACALIAAPIAALAGPISGYPAATTPLSGSETVIGTQSGSTVQITAASIAAVITGATSTWAGVQTFPAPGVNKGSIVLTPGTVSGTPANGSLWTTSGGVFAQIGGSAVQLYPASGTPAGSSGQLQYNNSGAFGGTSGLNWSGSALTIPDGGTLATTLDTFDKPVTSAVAAGTVAYSMAGGSGTFGCMAASGPGTYFLGAGGPTGSCVNPSVAWTNPASVTLTGATAINGVTTITGNTTINGSPTTFNDVSGVHNAGSISWTGSPAHANWSIPAGGILQMGGASLSPDAVTAGQVDVGGPSGTPGDQSGYLFAARLYASSEIVLPSPNISVVTPVITGGSVKLYQPIDFEPFAGNGFAIPPGSDALIAYGGSASGGNGTLALSLIGKSPAGVEYCDEFSPYCTNRQIDFFSSTNGMQAFGLESGPNNSQNLEIGLARDTGTITQISQLETLDWVIPAGGVQHYNITNGGSGYTAATATLTAIGCTEVPGTPTVLMSGGAVYGLSGADPGYGCSSVTVSISGNGTGATATTTLTTNPDAHPAGPQTMWHQPGITGFAPYLGMGQADLKPNRLLIGESDNQALPWETTPGNQPTLVIPGHVEFDTANGAGHLGFTGGESFSDAGGGVLQLQNAALSASAGLQLAFERAVPTTVSGLATVDPLPADGDRAYVTNATTCTFGSAITGGGSTHCPVHFDSSSSSWKAG